MIWILIAFLSALMGLTLGLLGGGGSILAVPILTYVVGIEAKAALATSLLVVGATSALCVVQHNRAGNVRWKTGLVFGGVAMIGAYAGGMAAQFISGTTLLLLFAAMMLAAGLAMLRRRAQPIDDTQAPRPVSLWKAGIEGLLVGAFTGLVGAGGGFLVVPALLLFGGLDMRSAIGTSTLVITMKSFAGFAGYATHVTIDFQLAAIVVGFAIVGSFAGTTLGRRIEPAPLRRVFAYFVLLMAAVIVYRQAPPELAAGLTFGVMILFFLNHLLRKRSANRVLQRGLL